MIVLDTDDKNEALDLKPQLVLFVGFTECKFNYEATGP